MILLVGAGRMGYAMLTRWLDESAHDISVLEPQPSEELLRLHQQKKFSLNPSLSDLKHQEISAFVLAVKPDKVLEAAAPLKDILAPESLLISIAAGQRLAPILEASGARTRGALRAMPNTPAQIGKGFVALYYNRAASPDQRQLGLELMSVLGETAAIEEESLLDAVTVLSGCGPAYLFYLAEILVAAGQSLGLDKKWAENAAIATLSGAAALLEDSKNAALLRQQVSSPGGVTQAALEVLMKDDALKALFLRAFAAAHKRSVELGK